MVLTPLDPAAALVRPQAMVPPGLDATAVLRDRQRLAMVPQPGPALRASFDQLAAVAVAALGGDRGAINLFAGAERTLIGSDAPAGFRWPTDPGLCRFTLALGEPLLVGDVLTDRVAALEGLEALGVRAYAAAPIRLAGERVGTVCVLCARPRAWTFTHARRLTALAGLAEHLLDGAV